MFNIYNSKIDNPLVFRQFKCGESLMTLYNCPLKSQFQDVWSHHNYVIYVVEGRKTWHTAHGSYELTQGSCVFVRKGAAIIEQFFDAAFCLVTFYIPDDFICEVLKSRSVPIHQTGRGYEPIISLHCDDTVQAFFNSMISLFDSRRDPDLSLIEIKFRELILTLAGTPQNAELLAYFYTLLQEPQAVSLQMLMEENYCFNLKLEQFAQLSNKSLSTFKRDFEKIFKTTPGKWLLQKRLNHAHNLLSNTDKTVNEAAFESGFESRSHFSRAFRQRFGMSPRSSKKEVDILVY